jgi:hypothetical protein
MTHFLARLVDRARGTAPRVEPLIAPRFAASESLGTELLPETSIEMEARPVVPMPAPPNPDRQETARPQEERKSSTASTNDHENEERPATELEVEPLLVPPIAQPQQSSVARQKEESGGVLESSHLSINQGVPVVTRQKQRTRLTRSTRGAVPAIGELRLPNDSDGQAPIVRVTIGRIDVRAAPTPAPPARKSPPQSGPTLTLDAYLQQRKEGKR